MATRKQSTRQTRRNVTAPVEPAPVKAEIDEPVSQDPTADPTSESTPKKRQPSLTLSQRRALLRGLDAHADGEAVTVASDFRALPFRHLLDCGYAVEETPLSFRLTEAGVERAVVVNPAYRAWAAGESVAGDETRPVAGEHRALPKAERTTVQAWIAHL